MIAACGRAWHSLSTQTGFTRFVAASSWRRERLLVVSYHGVSLADEHEWDPELYISPMSLLRRLNTLARIGCTVLPLEEAVRRLYDGTLPHCAVTLTFDDGFYDFKAQAFPLLKAHGYPATVYVTTKRSKPVLQLIASYLFWKHRHTTLDARGIEGLDRVYVLASRTARNWAVADMLARKLRDSMDQTDEEVFTREVMARLEIDYDRVLSSHILGLMTPGDFAEMSGQGMAIELHTHRHRTPEDPDEFIDDLRLNRTKLEAAIGRKPRHLCYPGGVCRAAYLPRLIAEGIETATTCDPALASRASYCLLLPRFIDNEIGTESRFEAWITGVAGWLPHRSRIRNGVH
jgi:peptidoglycan/xylan/chitin deacetylase (PgdA/CDA1 family)